MLVDTDHVTRIQTAEMLRGTALSSVGARLAGLPERNASNQSQGTWEAKRFEQPKANPDHCIGTPAYRW